MEHVPEVSVIVPAHDARRTIRRALDSALAGDGPSLEVVVVDDASTDGTADLVEQAYASEPRVRVRRLAANAGPAHARNAGLAEARGRWIALLDADDAWRPGRLARLLAAAGDADAVFDNLMGFDAHLGAETGPIFPVFPEEGIDAAALLAPQAPGTGYDLGYLKPMMRAAFLRRQALRYDERLRAGEDLVFYLGLLVAGARTRTVPEAGYLYTTPVGQASGRVSAHSQTVPKDDLVREALEGVLARERPRLDGATVQAIERRIAHLREVGPVALFHHARLRRDVGTMCRLLWREPPVRREVGRKLARLLGRARPLGRA